MSHEFLSKKKSVSEAHSNKPYWEARRRQWLPAVQELYGNIQKWLQPSVNQGMVTIKRTQMRIEEPYLGSYEVERLELQVGDETVYIEPQGVVIANVLEEVVMRGEAGLAKLWLLPASDTGENNHVWRLVWPFTKVNDMKELSVLNQDNFAKVLMSIMRPDIDES